MFAVAIKLDSSAIHINSTDTIMRTHISLGPFIGVILTLAFATLAAKGHTVIVYPGWRENNLHSNGTVDETNGAGVAIRSNTSELLYPYGMQWIYPCTHACISIPSLKKLHQKDV